MRAVAKRRRRRPAKPEPEIAALFQTAIHLLSIYGVPEETTLRVLAIHRDFLLHQLRARSGAFYTEAILRQLVKP